jgi:very-short-patch-repair endonuclease
MKSDFKKKRRELRKNMPLPEVILWQKIRANQLGVKFRRQHQIGDYILDFYCPEKKLGIEIDGESHFISSEIQKRDESRDQNLAKKKIKILRFLNPEIMKNLEGVLIEIVEEIKRR